ncbi:MAG: type II toxin-antitoxin system HicA family toxin [Acidimicrobiales bacterium]
MSHLFRRLANDEGAGRHQGPGARRLAARPANDKTGFHRQYCHPDRPGTVTVAGKLSAEIPRGTPAAVWRQAGP